MVIMLKNKCSVWKRIKFLHSDITVIILHVQILILYNWRPYLSITPRMMHVQKNIKIMLECYTWWYTE